MRLLRLLRGLSAVRELRLVLATLFRSVPSMGHIAVLLGIVLYSYAIVGFKNFGEHDPAHWGSLGVSVLTLFEIVTLDGWSNVMRPLIKVEPLAWLYFVSFVIFTAYIVTNLFIAVVIRNLDEVRQERPHPGKKSSGNCAQPRKRFTASKNACSSSPISRILLAQSHRPTPPLRMRGITL